MFHAFWKLINCVQYTRKTSVHAVAAIKESALNSKDFGLTEPKIFAHRNIVLLSLPPEPLLVKSSKVG